MPGVLFTGPPAAGKSQAARELLTQLPQGVLIDFQTLYAAVLGLLRQDDGRYAQRDPQQAYALAMAEYLRRAAITAALEMELEPLVSNSDGSPDRRRFLLGLMGPGATEQVIDPGIDIIRERLSNGGILSAQCGQAMQRYYGRL